MYVCTWNASQKQSTVAKEKHQMRNLTAFFAFIPHICRFPLCLLCENLHSDLLLVEKARFQPVHLWNELVECKKSICQQVYKILPFRNYKHHNGPPPATF